MHAKEKEYRYIPIYRGELINPRWDGRLDAFINGLVRSFCRFQTSDTITSVAVFSGAASVNGGVNGGYGGSYIYLYIYIEAN